VMPDMKPRLPRLTRRRFLAVAGLSVCGLGTYTWRIEPHWVELVQRDLPIGQLPAELENQVLVQISDIHVGAAVDEVYLISSLRSIASLDPALIVITGDFMTCHGAEQLQAVTRVFGHLPPARYGCFGIMGNHDYGLGWWHEDVADQLVVRLGEL